MRFLEIQQVARHLSVGGDRAGIEVQQVALAAPLLVQRVRAGEVGVKEDPALQRAGRPAGAVARVDDDFDAPREMELGGDLVDVGLGQIHAALAARTRQEVGPVDQAADLLDLVAMNRG